MSEQSVPAQQATADVSTESTEAKQESQPTQEQVRKFKLKIDGQELEYDESAVVALAQKGKAADERFRKAAEERKRVESLVKQFNDDPDSVIKALTGRDAEEIYRERLAKKLEELGKSPEQIEYERTQAELKKYKDREEAERKKSGEQYRRQLEQQYHDEYNVAIPKAINDIGLPATPETVSAMAKVMLEAEEEGITMPPSAAAQIVRDQFMGLTNKFVKSSDPEKLYELLGEDVIRKLMSVDAKRKPSPVKHEAVLAKKDDNSAPKKSMTFEEYGEMVKKWASGG